MNDDRFACQSGTDSIRKSSWSLLVLSLILMVLHRSHSYGQDVPQYRFQREIETGKIKRDELVTFSLDTSVYANTQDRLRDLRIEDSESTTVPFIVRRKRETESYDAEKTWSADDISLKPISESGLEIRFELDADDPTPDGLRIFTPLNNFEQRVTIVGIDEAGQETLLVEDEVIFDYSQFMDVRSVEIQLPELDVRSFQIEIDALTTRQQSQLTELTRKLSGTEEVSKQLRTAIIDRPFRIDRIELWAEYQQPRSKIVDTRQYDLVSFNSMVSSETNQTIIDVESKTQPLTQFEIVTPEQNFQRTARVYEVTSEGDKEIRQLVTETQLVHLDFRDLQKSELTIEFPRNRHGRYQIVIENGDNPALPVDDILAAGEVDEIVFIARKSTNYRLQYRNPNLDKPNLDIATIQALLEEEVEPLGVTLSENESVITAVIDQPKSLFDLFNNVYFIGSVVSLMITILVWLLYLAAKKIENFPEEPHNQNL